MYKIRHTFLVFNFLASTIEVRLVIVVTSYILL